MSHLLAFLKPDETAAELIARTHVDPIHTGLRFASTLRPGQVLEVSGPSGAAKTEILAQVIATTILPKHLGPAPAGGCQENIVLFDLDRKFDVLRLVSILTTRLQALGQHGQMRPEDLHQARQDCLQRVHIIQCSSSFQFLAGLKTCSDLLASLKAEGGLRLLLVDNVAAFHALDRISKPLPQYVVDGSTDAQLNLQQAHACIAGELHALARQHRLAVIATRHSGAPASSGFDREEPADMWQMRDPLPKAWQDLVKARLMVRGPLLSQQQDRPHFAVKWHSPADGGVQNFAVTDSHLIRC